MTCIDQEHGCHTCLRVATPVRFISHTPHQSSLALPLNFLISFTDLLLQLLLLGQAESGKSTLQKQFQLFYAPASLDEERASWRAVIYFNVVRNVKRILQALEALNLGSPQNATISLPGHNIAGPSSASAGPSSSTAVAGPSSSSAADNSLDAQDEAEIAEQDALAKAESEGGLPTLTNTTRRELATLKLRLSPLLTAEASLADRLSGGVPHSTLHWLSQMAMLT